MSEEGGLNERLLQNCDFAINREIINEDGSSMEKRPRASKKITPFSTFFQSNDNGIEPHINLPDLPPIQPFLDQPPVIPDTIQHFRPPNWRGLMAAIQNEPIDPVQLGKDIFEETQGIDEKYKCILNGLAGKPFRLDLQTLYQRRTELVKRLDGDDDIMVQLYDFNMGCLAKMDLDRRAFNSVASIVNQNIFYKAINEEKIPEQYKFNPNRMRELIFFTPVEIEEYKSTNSADVINAIVAMELSDQEEIARQITIQAYTSCIKPEFLGQMSVTTVNGKRTLRPEFFAFLKRTLYQSFGLPYYKFSSLKLPELVSGLPTGDYPYERATAVIITRIAIETLKALSTEHASEVKGDVANDSEHSTRDEAPSQKKKAHRGCRGRKRKAPIQGPNETE